MPMPKRHRRIERARTVGGRFAVGPAHIITVPGHRNPATGRYINAVERQRLDANEGSEDSQAISLIKIIIYH